MYITHIKRNSRTLYVVSKLHGGKTQFLKMKKNNSGYNGWIYVVKIDY